MRRSSNAATLCEDLIGLFQRFFASDIEPFPFELESFHRLALVKPSHKQAWPIGIISRGKVGGQEGGGFARVIINGKSGQSATRFLRLFLTMRDGAVRIERALAI